MSAWLDSAYKWQPRFAINDQSFSIYAAICPAERGVWSFIEIKEENSPTDKVVEMVNAGSGASVIPGEGSVS